MKRSTFLLGLGSAAVAATLPFTAWPQQTFPTKPLRLLVGYLAGGGTDEVARLYSTELSSILHQPVVVENRAGAGGVIATQALIAAPADGHTLMFTVSPHITNALLNPKAYDPIGDVSPVSLVATVPFVLCANPSLPANNPGELIKLAKDQPGKLTYGSSGNGTPAHLFQELLNRSAGLKLVHIPYKGAAQAATDLMGGTISLLWLSTVQAMPFLTSGRLKALAISTAQRSSTLPAVPSLSESVVPGFNADMWWGVIAPRGVPRATIQILQQALQQITKSESVRTKLISQGAIPVGGGATDLARLLKEENEKWGRVIREANIHAE